AHEQRSVVFPSRRYQRVEVERRSLPGIGAPRGEATLVPGVCDVAQPDAGDAEAEPAARIGFEAAGVHQVRRSPRRVGLEAHEAVHHAVVRVLLLIVFVELQRVIWTKGAVDPRMTIGEAPSGHRIAGRRFDAGAHYGMI